MNKNHAAPKGTMIPDSNWATKTNSHLRLMHHDQRLLHKASRLLMQEYENSRAHCYEVKGRQE